VGSFNISPDGLMTYDHEGTINGPDRRTVELYALAVSKITALAPRDSRRSPCVHLGYRSVGLIQREHAKSKRPAREGLKFDLAGAGAGAGITVRRLPADVRASVACRISMLVELRTTNISVVFAGTGRHRFCHSLQLKAHDTAKTNPG
jgi:hypothetical protein